MDRARRWILVWNNWTLEDYDYLLGIFRSKGWKWIVGKETGEAGTPHLQAYFEAKSAIDFDSLKRLFAKCHLEKAKGKWEENYKYCSKEGDWETNMDAPKEELDLVKLCLTREYANVEWRPWQSKILKLLDSPADKRKIHWILDERGHSGKSYLAKFIALTKNVIIADGCKKDVFNQVLSYYKPEKGPKPTELLDAVILDLPRSTKDYLGAVYGTLEKLKDGNIYSGKYKGGQVQFPQLHVIVFANWSPDFTQWSDDRYDVTDIQYE